MPYQLTTASGPADVIAQIVAFALDNGFSDEGTTVVSDNNFTPARSVTLTRIKRGSIYWTFRVDPRATSTPTPEYAVNCRMSYSIASGAYPTETNGQEGWSVMSLWGFPGPYPNLFLYCDGVTDAIHVALELASGIFNHMSFGMIEKTETFTGGEYITAGQLEWKSPVAPFLYPTEDNLEVATNHPFLNGSNIPDSSGYTSSPGTGANYIRSILAAGAANNKNDFAMCGVYKNGQSASMCGYKGMQESVLKATPNSPTLRTPLFPLYVFIRDEVSGLWRTSGLLPGMAVCSNSYVDAKEVILTDWQVFPITQRFGDRTLCPDSGKRGVAYKRVA